MTDNQQFLVKMIPTAILVILTVAFGVLGFPIVADVTGAMIPIAWAVGLGMALSASHNRTV